VVVEEEGERILELDAEREGRGPSISRQVGKRSEGNRRRGRGRGMGRGKANKV
jgi:hypothetical protein